MREQTELLLWNLLLNATLSLSEIKKILGVEERQVRNELKLLRESLARPDSVKYDRKLKLFKLGVLPKEKESSVVGLIAAQLRSRFGLGDRALSGLAADYRLRAVLSRSPLDMGVRAATVMQSLSPVDVVVALTAITAGEAIEPAEPRYGWPGPLLATDVVDLGTHWALRGFCLEEECWVFRPLLGQLSLKASSLSVDEAKATPMYKQGDWEWRSSKQVALSPHPKLGREQQIQVYQQFLGPLPQRSEDSLKKAFDIKVALIPYFLIHHRVDTSVKGKQDPAMYPLWLANRPSLYEALLS